MAEMPCVVRLFKTPSGSLDFYDWILCHTSARCCSPMPRTCPVEAVSDWKESGEPGGNRTHNPQIKSLLLCQLSYRPEEVRR